MNSRNLPPLTELITKLIEGTASIVILSAEENWRQAFEVNEPRTSELVNIVFSRQTGIQSASKHLQIDKPMVRLYKAHSRLIIRLGSKLYPSNKHHMLNKDLTRLMLSLARVR